MSWTYDENGGEDLGVWVQTTKYPASDNNPETAVSHSWFIWSATGKSSGNTITIPVHISFEWADGNPNVSDRVGRSVVVTGSSGKIGIATTGQTPFGVVTGRAAFVGNTAGRWHQRYLKDEYLRTIKDENGNDVPNPEFNSACAYFTREQRAEWDPIGMMGKIPVRVGEPLNPNWMKLRVISPTVEEYLVR